MSKADTLTTLWRLIVLNAGFYGCLLLMTAFSIVVVWGPYFLWLRYAQGHTRGEAMRRMIWAYGKVWTKLLALFAPVQVQGDSQSLPIPCIVTPNHQSFFDAYCIGFLRIPNVLFAVRGWPFRIPVYGPYMRAAEYLNTEGLSGEQILARSQSLLSQGASIVIYPEGTRSPDRRLQRFHAGAFHLSLATGVPIVPLCIDGTSIFLKKGGWLLRPANINISILEPVYPAQFCHYGDESPLVLRHHVKDKMQNNLQKWQNTDTHRV